METNSYIYNELIDFKQYHKNQINVIVHIFTGIIYMSCLNVLLLKGKLLILYFLLITITHNIFDAFLSILFIYCGTKIILKYKIKSLHLVFGFLFACFIIPEISHLLTNEKIQLNFNNVTPMKFITNITYFLPFSINTFNSL